MKKIFPEGSITTICKRGKNLKEILSPSLYPKKPKAPRISYIVSCTKCDICRNFLICENRFKCKASGKSYFVKGNPNCNSANVIYLISCTNCGDQYVGSAKDFKNRFRIHKSDINTGKDRCGTARHFLNKCRHPESSHMYMKIQMIEAVNSNNVHDVEDTLWREILANTIIY